MSTLVMSLNNIETYTISEDNFERNFNILYKPEIIICDTIMETNEKESRERERKRERERELFDR